MSDDRFGQRTNASMTGVDTSIRHRHMCRGAELCYTGAVSPESDRFSAVLAVQGGDWQSGICHTTVADVPSESRCEMVAG